MLFQEIEPTFESSEMGNLFLIIFIYFLLKKFIYKNVLWLENIIKMMILITVENIHALLF